MLLMRCIVVAMFSFGLTILGAGVVSGQDYPSKTIRIVTSGAGGSNDFSARLIATALAGALSQPVIVENRGGGFNSEEAVFQALPDGYTVLYTGSGLWLTPFFRKTPYDVVKDFLPVTITTREPQLLVVTSSLPAKSIKELIALAKAKPGELNYSLASTGGLSHIASELFKSMAGVNIVGVPYKSGSQERSDLISGQVQLTITSPTSVIEHVKLGKLRALAITSLESSALAPGLPTVAATVPKFESVQIQGVFAPAKTPEAIVKRLNQEIVRVLNQPDVKQKFFDKGSEVVGNSPEEAGAKRDLEMAKWGKLIRDLNIKVE